MTSLTANNNVSSGESTPQSAASSPPLLLLPLLEAKATATLFNNEEDSEVAKNVLFTAAATTTNGSPSEALELGSMGVGEGDDQECGICESKLASPRVLSCLHVFCEACLDQLPRLEDSDDSIGCPNCQQETQVGFKGAACLPCDYVLTNILDMTAIESMSVICTSCKTKEKAVARCSDCANFLCPNCNTAHQFMRCFESHKVIAFEDLKRSSEAIPIHKPIFCRHHPVENLKFYCYTCMVKYILLY